jgi:nucleolar GTP-binding protein
MRKVKFTYSNIEEKINSIVTNFPKLDDIHPFYGDLINILYDKDHYKMALGYLHTAKNITEKISNDYVKLLKYADSLYRCKQLKVAALGRMATTLKKLSSSLNYLEEVRKHLGRLPSIDPNSRTLILTGFPNVGKSSFMNKITYAGSEVQPYPFTTQSIYAGHTYYKSVRWQVLDTPGVLDRPLEERNTIEMQAITAMAHLDACILYFIDISENCGYSIQQQVSLFTSIKPLFKNKPLVIILNKTDLKPYSEVDSQDKEMLESLAKEHNTYLVQMSNETGNGVNDVKTSACEILTEYRKAHQANGKKGKSVGDNVLDKIYVAQPNAVRDNRKRNPNIPSSVMVEKQREEQESEIYMNNLTESEKQALEQIKLREGDTYLLEKKIKYNRVREEIEKNGGEGVFYIPDRTHFILEKPEWQNDIWPEFMDGKNVFDFVDPDIQEKLERLEEEEDGLREMDNGENYSDGDESSELSEDLIEAHDEMLENKKAITKKHKMVKASQLPRKVRDLTITERFMNDLRTDKQEQVKGLKLLSQKQNRDRKDKLKKSLLAERKFEEEDENIEEFDNDMDVDDDEAREAKKRRIEGIAEKKQKEKQAKHQKEQLIRMQTKITKKMNRGARVNEADRQIPSKLPRHLNSGKRSNGKTDRR